MPYEFDANKDKINSTKHGLSLLAVAEFEWEVALIRCDIRKQYTEPRFQAISYVGNRLCILVYCLRGDMVRVISLRKANQREIKYYAKT